MSNDATSLAARRSCDIVKRFPKRFCAKTRRLF